MIKPQPARYDEAKAKARFDESLSQSCKLVKMTATMKRRALRRKPEKPLVLTASPHVADPC